MKSIPLAGSRSILSAAFACGSLALLLASAAPQAQACGSRWKELPHVYQTVFLLPTVANRMEHWADKYDLAVGDSMFILLPENAKLSIVAGEGSARLAAYETLTTEQRARSGNFRMPLEQKGYKWRKLIAFASGDNSNTIAIDAGGKKTELKINIRSYKPEYQRPEPDKMRSEKTTREKPFYMTQGDAVEIVLPGELADGWSLNSGKETGIELRSVERMPFVSGQPAQVKLTLAAASSRSPDPVRLVIKRGGDSGESFEYYIGVWPAPKC